MVNSYARTYRKMYGGSGGRRRKRRYIGRKRRRPARAFCSLGPEKKFHDMLYSADPVGSTWALLSHAGGQSLNLIAQGLTEKTRVGRRICVHNINIKGEVVMPTATTAIGRQLVKLALVMDRQANGADGAASDVWEVAASGLHSYRNLAAAPRFKVLWSKVFTMNSSISGNGTTIDTNEMLRFFNCSVKLEEPIEYDGATGAITEIQSVNFFLMGVALASSPAVTMTARCRIRFTD